MATPRIQSYVLLVREFSSRSVFFHAAVADKLGLNLTDLKSLHLLGRGSMTASDLAEEVGLTGAATTALIDRLCTAGYAIRTRDQVDRRRVTISIVKRNFRKVEQLYKGQYARMSRLLSQYSEQEFAAVSDFLEKTAQILTEEAKKLRSR